MERQICDLAYKWNLKTNKKLWLIEEEIRILVMIGGGWEEGESKEGGQKVQTFGYKISTSHIR